MSQYHSDETHLPASIGFECGYWQYEGFLVITHCAVPPTMQSHNQSRIASEKTLAQSVLPTLFFLYVHFVLVVPNRLLSARTLSRFGLGISESLREIFSIWLGVCS